MAKERKMPEKDFIVIEDSLSELFTVFSEKRGYCISLLIGDSYVGESLSMEMDYEDYEKGKYLLTSDEDLAYYNIIKEYLKEEKKFVYKLITDDDYYGEIRRHPDNIHGESLIKTGEMLAIYNYLSKTSNLNIN